MRNSNYVFDLLVQLGRGFGSNPEGNMPPY